MEVRVFSTAPFASFIIFGWGADQEEIMCALYDGVQRAWWRDLSSHNSLLVRFCKVFRSLEILPLCL
ncbi:hypothetical protein [Bartonella sp. B41]